MVGGREFGFGGREGGLFDAFGDGEGGDGVVFLVEAGGEGGLGGRARRGGSGGS